jgi:DNA repair protein RecO (recombination protein O)
MEWSDRGIVLSSRRHGEGAAIVEVLTCTHGRHLGLVRGGASMRQSQVLQPGNTLNFVWRARLSEHLGTYRCEIATSRAAALIETRQTVAGLQSLCALAHLLAERDPVEGLYSAFELILDQMVDGGPWPALMIRWEVELLRELGFGLNLTSCASNGSFDNLIYVSPKSGRAVSASAGEPYRTKLLHLPQFLTQKSAPATGEDIISGLNMTGHFLVRDVLGPRSINLPDARERLIRLLGES